MNRLLITIYGIITGSPSAKFSRPRYIPCVKQVHTHSSLHDGICLLVRMIIGVVNGIRYKHSTVRPGIIPRSKRVIVGNCREFELNPYNATTNLALELVFNTGIYLLNRFWRYKCVTRCWIDPGELANDGSVQRYHYDSRLKLQDIMMLQNIYWKEPQAGQTILKCGRNTCNSKPTQSSSRGE